MSEKDGSVKVPTETESKNLKRSHAQSEKSNILSDVSTILLDIEGTTSSITYVKNTLFPYVRKHVKSYLEDQWDNKECQETIDALRKLCKEDKEAGTDDVVEIPDETVDKEHIIAGVVANINWQMDSDRKSTALKQQQGLLYRDGFTSGKLKAHMYEDVPDALKLWTSQKKNIYIYSSGSLEAQILFFTYSEYGDLNKCIKGNFDTTTGMKGEKQSYMKIIKAVDTKPERIIFLTDVVAEAEAASAAGMKVCLVEREGNAPITEEERKKYLVIESFSDLLEEDDEPPAKK